MSDPVYMQIPVPDSGDIELRAIAAIVWILEERPFFGSAAPSLLNAEEKRRVVNYIAARYAPASAREMGEGV
jgi:hypothetical protein